MNTVETEAVRYMIGRNGQVTHAVVPIELWQEVSGDDPAEVGSDWPEDEETRRRIKESMDTPESEAVPLAEALVMLGIGEEELR